MSIFNRNTLKGFFQKGSLPTEEHFANLIDSTINKIDDGFTKTSEHGLKIASGGDSQKLVSFYDDIKKRDPLWYISLNPDEVAKGLSFSQDQRGSALFLQEGGNIGVGNTQPQHTLDINGTVAMRRRVGVYQRQSEAAADAEWHIILNDLSGCHVFEIVARVAGVKKRGKYAMAHAMAVSAFDSSSNTIRVTQACYGFFWHRLKFRWRRSENGKYRLEIKTADHYGMDQENKVVQIQYHITSLWEDSQV
jgi:hypothetical protein